MSLGFCQIVREWRLLSYCRRLVVVARDERPTSRLMPDYDPYQYLLQYIMRALVSSSRYVAARPISAILYRRTGVHRYTREYTGNTGIRARVIGGARGKIDDDCLLPKSQAGTSTGTYPTRPSLPARYRYVPVSCLILTT